MPKTKMLLLSTVILLQLQAFGMELDQPMRGIVVHCLSDKELKIYSIFVDLIEGEINLPKEELVAIFQQEGVDISKILTSLNFNDKLSILDRVARDNRNEIAKQLICAIYLTKPKSNDLLDTLFIHDLEGKRYFRDIILLSYANSEAPKKRKRAESSDESSTESAEATKKRKSTDPVPAETPKPNRHKMAESAEDLKLCESCRKHDDRFIIGFCSRCYQAKRNNAQHACGYFYTPRQMNTECPRCEEELTPESTIKATK